MKTATRSALAALAMSVMMPVLISVMMPDAAGTLEAQPVLDLSGARPFAFNILELSDPDGLSGPVALEGLRWDGDSAPLYSGFIEGRPNCFETAAYLDDSIRAVSWTLGRGPDSRRGLEELPAGFADVNLEVLRLPPAPARINASAAAAASHCLPAEEVSPCRECASYDSSVRDLLWLQRFLLRRLPFWRERSALRANGKPNPKKETPGLRLLL